MKTRKETKSNAKKSYVLSSVLRRKPVTEIIGLLERNPGQEFNPTAIKKETGLALNIVTATLDRLLKSGKICKPHPGFYSMECTLSKQQLDKLERESNLNFHNTSIKILKEFQNGKQRCEGTVPPETTDIQDNSNGKINVLEFGINRKLTTFEYKESYLVMVGCSENPLSISEFIMLISLLNTIFGEEAVQKAIIVKLDINNDIPMTFSPNQLTLGDVSRMCFAVYGKGNKKTRIELRNFGVRVPVSKFLAQLTKLLVPEAEPEAVKMKVPERKSKLPLSEFVTALELSKLYLSGYDWNKPGAK